MQNGVRALASPVTQAPMGSWDPGALHSPGRKGARGRRGLAARPPHRMMTGVPLRGPGVHTQVKDPGFT